MEWNVRARTRGRERCDFCSGATQEYEAGLCARARAAAPGLLGRANFGRQPAPCFSYCALCASIQQPPLQHRTSGRSQKQQPSEVSYTYHTSFPQMFNLEKTNYASIQRNRSTIARSPPRVTAHVSFVNQPDVPEPFDIAARCLNSSSEELPAPITLVPASSAPEPVDRLRKNGSLFLDHRQARRGSFVDLPLPRLTPKTPLEVFREIALLPVEPVNDPKETEFQEAFAFGSGVSLRSLEMGTLFGRILYHFPHQKRAFRVSTKADRLFKIHKPQPSGILNSVDRIVEQVEMANLVDNYFRLKAGRKLQRIQSVLGMDQ
uniref:Uncharacterized protein n=1 Tax=Spironucleus salmonicida TaxID=348837 RepID=V6LLS8_9EUKA|eukprot:EST45622.1 Hypothetical protein SS50377_14479 [Spironucleus salmonicida]